MPLTEKQRREQDPERPGYAVFKRRPRIGLIILAILTPLVLYAAGASLYSLGTYLSASLFEASGDDPEEQASEETSAGEDAAGEENEAPAAPPPEDPTLYLTVPRLGIQSHTVRNDRSEQALGLGAIKLPSTGFPWEAGDTNTYIACHRLGFPGNESYNQCLNLPSMQQGDEISLQDANGTVYEYRVSEVFAVGPSDSYVTEPLDGRDVVTLQTCTETPTDWVTLGPRLISSGPESGRLIVRADRIV